MKQLGLDFACTRIGRCEACGGPGVLNARICRRCEAAHGRRVAELLARANREPDFARRCFESLRDPVRTEFVRTLNVAALGQLRPGLHKCGAKVADLRIAGSASFQ